MSAAIVEPGPLDHITLSRPGTLVVLSWAYPEPAEAKEKSLHVYAVRDVKVYTAEVPLGAQAGALAFAGEFPAAVVYAWIYEQNLVDPTPLERPDVLTDEAIEELVVAHGSWVLLRPGFGHDEFSLDWMSEEWDLDQAGWGWPIETVHLPDMPEGAAS